MNYEYQSATSIIVFIMDQEDLYEEVTTFASSAQDERSVSELIADRYYQILNTGLETIGRNQAYPTAAAKLIQEMCFGMPWSVFESAGKHFYTLTH